MKTAVLIYDGFCNFEIAPLLEIFAIYRNRFTVFAKDLSPVRSEEGLTVLPDKTIFELDIDEYDSLVLPGAEDIGDIIRDENILGFIKEFSDREKLIGAISIAPVLLLKIGVLRGKPFMAGVNKDELFEEGFTENDLSQMKDWDFCVSNPSKDGCIVCDNIITSVSFYFVKWALGFANLLGVMPNPKMFGLEI